MDADKLNKVGVQFKDGKAHVQVWAPFASKVVLRNETTDKEFPLKKSKFYWTLITEGLRVNDLYRFSLNDGNFLPDPASLSQPQGVFGPSQAIDISTFSWTDKSWTNHPLGDYVVYELHVGTFTREGTFDGVVSKLDYLKDLGITAIEIMPVAQFSGARNWGYDGVFPFAVQNSYGGAFAFQQMVDACHAKGIAVILDVVYNHFGPEGNVFEKYGRYLTEKYKTPWGKAINFDDAYCDPVREYFIQNALMWLNDFHVDALRLDAVHAIKDFSPKHIVDEMMEAVEKRNTICGSEKYLIAEIDLNDSIFIRSKDDCGFGVNAQWIDEFHHALRVACGQEQTGYYADFSGVEDLAKAFRDGYVYTGQYSKERNRKFGTSTKGISGDKFVVFSQNHDQVGNRMMGERTAQLVSFELLKVMAAVVLVSPFVPLLFMGEEWAASSPFTYFVDFEDEELLENIQKGRAKEFEAFHADGKAPVPHAEETFLNAKLDWEEQNEARHKTMLAYYKKLIALRKNEPALKNYDRDWVEVFHDSEQGVLIVERSFKEQRLLCLFNFSKNQRTAHFDSTAAPMHVLLSSCDKKWLGPHDLLFELTSGNINMHPESVLLLAHQDV